MNASLSALRSSPLLCLATLMLLAACGESKEPDEEKPGTTRGYSDCGSNSGSLVRCQPGQYCSDSVLSLCNSGCLTDNNCSSNQVCEKQGGNNVGTCQNTSTAACSASQPCPGGQTCVNGVCQAQSAQCTPRPDGLDGCDNLSLCIASGPQTAACVSFAACGAGGTCPVGLTGAVCNDGYIPNKGRFCLPEACTQNYHCPANWACVKYPATSVLGECSDRAFGAGCTQDSECLSNRCFGASPGLMGTCAP
jgi:hypothetical protein